jgi:phage virion morphogenesis protein
MSGVQITIELKEQEAALAELAGYIARAANPQGLFENIGASLVTSTQQRFETGVGVDGSPWPPSLRVIAHGGKTLELSGRLMRSITFIARATGLELGSNVIYAAIHQFGGAILQAARKATVHFKRSKRTGERLAGFRKAGKGTEAQEVSIGARTIHMPARPYVGLDDDDDREILRISEDWLAGEQKAAA